MGSANETFDTAAITVIDNHCHPLELASTTKSPEEWRRYFSEAVDDGKGNLVTVGTAYYRRLISAMARFHEVDDNEEAVLAARASYSPKELASRLFRDAAIEGAVVDLGYPPAGASFTREDFVEATGSTYGALLRVELLFQQRIAEFSRYDELVERLRDDLSDLRGSGYVGLKSIAGYRTGLNIERWSNDDVQTAFANAREEASSTGSVRLGHKPLLDTLLHLALHHANRDELPVQFHVGYGDHDVDLRHASPLLLRSLMEDDTYRQLPIVLLHSCWPYFREGAFLASIYHNVYLDVSYGIPFLGAVELHTVTRAILGTAPFGKIMYSSDGARVPEIFWMSAHDGRRILSSTLNEMVGAGDLTVDRAHGVAEQMLRANALTLYGLG
jgi:predicted TIM-barrel fold metal-dependent hydrolase